MVQVLPGLLVQILRLKVLMHLFYLVQLLLLIKLLIQRLVLLIAWLSLITLHRLFSVTLNQEDLLCVAIQPIHHDVLLVFSRSILSSIDDGAQHLGILPLSHCFVLQFGLPMLRHWFVLRCTNDGACFVLLSLSNIVLARLLIV